VIRTNGDNDGRSDMITSEQIQRLSQKAKEEAKENDDIHAMLLCGEDDGRRSSIKKSLEHIKAVEELVSQVVHA
jgi:hypothetical protein